LEKLANNGDCTILQSVLCISDIAICSSHSDLTTAGHRMRI